MRFNNKYKFLNNTNFLISELSSRILKFKRPKWKKSQLNIVRSYEKIPRFFFRSGPNISFKKWDKLKSLFGESLRTNRILKTFYLLKCFNKKKAYLNLINNLFLSAFFQLDFLLTFFNYSRSVEESHQLLLKRKVKVNGLVCVNRNFILKAGDLVQIDLFGVFGDNKNKTFATTVRNNFIFAEADFYSNSIFIVKSISDISPFEGSLLLNDKISFYKIYNYIRR